MWVPNLVWKLLTDRHEADQRALEVERARVESTLVQMRGLHLMYERQVTALRVGHSAAIARADQAEVELARAQATVQWMSNHLTTVEHRAAELEARVLQINPIAMSVDASRLRDTPPATTRVDGEMAGTTVEDESFAELMENESVASLFEDVGDRRAAKMGYGDWDEAGHTTRS
jgi:hypothetical protein